MGGGTASPPRINTGTIDTAPWERIKHPGLEDNQVKQEAIWNEAFNQPDASGNWAVVPVNAEQTGEIVTWQGEEPQWTAPGQQKFCTNCGMEFGEDSKKFCTGCGNPRPDVTQTTMQALTDGNMSNAPNNRRRGNVQSTEIVPLPGQPR